MRPLARPGAMDRQLRQAGPAQRRLWDRDGHPGAARGRLALRGMKGRRCLWRRLLATVTVVLAVCAGAGRVPAAELTGLAGERLEYRVRWGVLNVASAVLEVAAAAPGEVVLRATARTRGWIDPVYPVRDLVESTVDAATLTPLRLYKRTKEGHGRPRVVEVEFDREAGVARYVRDGRARAPLELPDDFQDPLSCIYAYRALAPTAEGELAFKVTDGKRVISGTFREVRREKVRTPAGEFDTIVVEPDIKGIGGVFRRSKKATLRIWFTDDARRRPVRFYSEVAVGSFTMELIRLEHSPPEDGAETTARGAEPAPGNAATG